MSSAKSPKFRHRLAFRLTVWYGGLLALSALACFAAFYGLMISSMQARADSDLTRLANLLTQSLAQQGPSGLQAQIDTETASFGASHIFFRVLDPRGNVIASSSNFSSWPAMDRFAETPRSLPPPQASFEDLVGSESHGLVRALTAPIGQDLTLQVGVTRADDRRVIESLRRILAFVVVGTTVIAVLIGWLMARRALAGMHGVTQTTKQISQGASLESRVPVTGRGDEVDELANTVNGMLDRIQALVESMKQTNDHLAHELRSPVTRIRGRAEMTLISPSSPADFQAMAAGTVEECDRLLLLVNTMLDISEMEGRVGVRPLSDVDVARMVQDVCELFQPVAEDKRVTLHAESAGHCHVQGDFQRLQRALANLVDNAIKYSSEGGVVDIRAGNEGDYVAVAVRNSGPGIPADELPHVFERFYRGRNSRALPGNGLGLSLTRAIVRAHGGQLAVDSTENVSTTFTLLLPGPGASQFDFPR
jgi:heavy metal sensor kinase